MLGRHLRLRALVLHLHQSPERIVTAPQLGIFCLLEEQTGLFAKGLLREDKMLRTTRDGEKEEGREHLAVIRHPHVARRVPPRRHLLVVLPRGGWQEADYDKQR